MTTIGKLRFRLINLILYTCGFLLLWEWLRPLEQLDKTTDISVFLIFLVISLLLSLLNVHPVLSGLIKLLFILYALHFLYFDGSFFRWEWLSLLLSDVVTNVGFVFQQNWMGLSNLFKSILFFLLLLIMIYLIRYWLTNRKQIFLFFFMTLVYITVLDTFTPYEADFAIVRTVIVGFVVMGILTLERVLDRENIEKQFTFSKKWIIPLGMMIGFSVVIGYAVPKAEPIWPDPVPFIKSYALDSGSEGSGVSKIGYGEDDSRLGGPFIGDNTLVYKVESDIKHYWKVEVKDEYSGKGWESSLTQSVMIPFVREEKVPFSNIINGKIEVTEQTDTVLPIIEYPHLIYPLGVKRIESEPSYYFEAYLGLEKIYPRNTNNLSTIGEYSVVYDSPKYSVKQLMESDYSINPLLDPKLLSQYTQLPDGLPQRVKALAVEITKDESTWFHKAKAIENYFDRPEFVYDQKNVAVPKENEDYVDQFLFETMTGYCDNFSTSMVVLLRSLDIPARWVKGYTEGEYKGISESGQRMYEITNNNAHSWVEVFFPGVGWVPFEPTKGFSNNVQFSYEHLSTSQSNTASSATEKKPEVKKPQVEKERTQSSASSSSFKKIWDAGKEFFAKYWLRTVLVTLLLGLVIFVLYMTRVKWFPYYLLFRFRSRNRDEDFPIAYVTLLKQLNRYGLKRKSDQTLRDYAAYVDHFFTSDEMGTLTAVYEQYVYKGSLKDGSWEDTKQLWENLIKKTIA